MTSIGAEEQAATGGTHTADATDADAPPLRVACSCQAMADTYGDNRARQGSLMSWTRRWHGRAVEGADTDLGQPVEPDVAALRGLGGVAASIEIEGNSSRR